MKKLFYFLCFFGILGMFACRKSTSTPSYTDNIQNVWQVQSISDITHTQGMEDKITNTTGNPGDYFDFRKDGKLYVSLQNGQTKDTSNYSILSSNQFSVNGSTLANISTLTPNSFIFSIKTNGSGSNYDQSTFTLKR